MQQFFNIGRALFIVAALSIPFTAYAQGDARFTGTVLDPVGRLRSRRDGDRQERAHRRRAHGVSQCEGRYVVTSLRPSVYTISGDVRRLSRRSNSPACSWRPRRSSRSISTLQPAGVTETVTVTGNADGGRHELGAHRRQRQRARSAERCRSTAGRCRS